MIEIHNLEQGTDEWQALRAGKYTGSNAHKLLRFGAIEYALAQESNFKGNYYTKRGHLLEDQAIQVYEKITGASVLRAGFITNSKYPDCGYSPDGIDVTSLDGYALNKGGFKAEGYLLEVKCFNKKRHREIASGDIPMEIMAQIQFGMMITGMIRALLIIFNPDFAKKMITVKGNLMPNPDYEPKLAFKMIEIRRNVSIERNFKNILTKERV